MAVDHQDEGERDDDPTSVVTPKTYTEEEFKRRFRGAGKAQKEAEERAAAAEARASELETADKERAEKAAKAQGKFKDLYEAEQASSATKDEQLAAAVARNQALEQQIRKPLEEAVEALPDTAERQRTKCVELLEAGDFDTVQVILDSLGTSNDDSEEEEEVIRDIRDSPGRRPAGGKAKKLTLAERVAQRRAGGTR